MKTNLIIILGLILVNISCGKEDSDDVNQERIYTIYNMEYDQNDDQTIASSYYKFGDPTGTPLEISSPSETKFDGNEMDEKTLPVIHYEKEQTGFHNSGSFTFKDANGTEYTNVISYNSIDFSVDTITRTINQDLQWNGGALEQFEDIKVEIKNADFDYTFFTTEAVNSTSITLTSSKLSQLPTGQYTIQLTRRKTLPLQESTDAGGELSAKYKTLTKAVYLK